MNEPYYRILERSGRLTIACMTEDDEKDYDETKFFIDREGTVLKFNVIQDAIGWLNRNIKDTRIDPLYLVKVGNDYEDWYK